MSDAAEWLTKALDRVSPLGDTTGYIATVEPA